jgi:TRAP-type C4-dicarboxylate transport system permease small subunit
VKTLAKIDECVGRILLAAALFCFVALLAVLTGNLAIRLLAFGNLMGWYTDVTEILFGWMVLLAASVLARHREHFRIDLLHMSLGKCRWFYILEFTTNIIALVFFALLFHYGAKLFLGAPQTMSVLGIARRWAYLCIPFNAVFLCLYTLRDVVRSFMIMAGKMPVPMAPA